LLRSIRMRLDLCGETFAIYDVPAGVDLSILPRAQWSRRERALRANAKDAAFIQAELARLGVRLTDDEVRDAVADALDSDIVKGAAAVAAFGDRRAVPELSNAFDDFEHLDCAACDYVALSAIANAIHTLGGVPTDGQREKLAAYHDRQRGAWIKPPTYEEAVEGLAALGIDIASFDLDQPPPPRPRLGRNDPCHCGSGKKYKKCHLDEDARGGPASLCARH
jgi:hypothetical protein